MAKAKAREPVRPVERTELLNVAREAIRTASGLTGSEFKKKLPKPYQPHIQEVLSLARELASTGEVHRRMTGKTERFFSSDPLEALERTAFAILERHPLTQAALKQKIKETAPTLFPLFAEWWKSVVAGRRLFEQFSGATKTKIFGTRPDIRTLQKPLDAVRKALTGLESKGMNKGEIAAAVLEMLGIQTAALADDRAASSSPRAERVEASVAASSDPSNGNLDRGTFLDALHELARKNPEGALLPVRELRCVVRLSKERFDSTALLLAKEGAVTLHYHDHPASLPVSQRAELVQDDRGTYYMGIAFRRST